MRSHDQSLTPIPGSAAAPVRRGCPDGQPFDLRLPGNLFRPRCFTELYDPGLGAASTPERGR